MVAMGIQLGVHDRQALNLIQNFDVLVVNVVCKI
jgi:hypothetical protein